MSRQRYDPKDRFYKQAKKDGFAARSVYKLEEIDRRFGLLKRGKRVVDLGCSPGSWLQYIAEAVGPKGLVLGYDLVAPKVSLPAHVRTFEVDVHELTPERIITDAGSKKAFDALVSDLAPKTTGIRDADQARSIALVEHALWLAEALITDEGFFAAKVFQGRGFDELIAETRKRYKDVRALRPKATRQGSREAFLIVRGRRVSATDQSEVGEQGPEHEGEPDAEGEGGHQERDDQ